MLVLEQKRGDAVMLTLTEALPAGTLITVVLVEPMGYKARMGYDAPRSVTVGREKIWLRKRQESGEVDGNA